MLVVVEEVVLEVVVLEVVVGSSVVLEVVLVEVVLEVDEMCPVNSFLDPSLTIATRNPVKGVELISS